MIMCHLTRAGRIYFNPSLFSPWLQQGQTETVNTNLKLGLVMKSAARVKFILTERVIGGDNDGE